MASCSDVTIKVGEWLILQLSCEYISQDKKWCKLYHPAGSQREDYIIVIWTAQFHNTRSVLSNLFLFNTITTHCVDEHNTIRSSLTTVLFRLIICRYFMFWDFSDSQTEKRVVMLIQTKLSY